MTSAVPEGFPSRGVLSLEVRWILPGRLDTAVAAWFGTSAFQAESREDAYLLSPDLGGLSVKVRGGRALEVKAFLGSPGILELEGRARGLMQYWQKWSFPFRPRSHDIKDAGVWTRVGKHRRTIRFSSTGGRLTPAVAYIRELPGEALCGVELTEVRTQYGDWWSLGFETTGPAGSLGAGLEATAAMVFSQALPSGVEFQLADSASYADWLRSRPGAEGSAGP